MILSLVMPPYVKSLDTPLALTFLSDDDKALTTSEQELYNDHGSLYGKMENEEKAD